MHTIGNEFNIFVCLFVIVVVVCLFVCLIVPMFVYFLLLLLLFVCLFVPMKLFKILNRIKYVDTCFTHHPNVPKFCSLMNMTLKPKNVKFARLINCILDLF